MEKIPLKGGKKEVLRYIARRGQVTAQDIQIAFSYASPRYPQRLLARMEEEKLVEWEKFATRMRNWTITDTGWNRLIYYAKKKEEEEEEDDD